MAEAERAVVPQTIAAGAMMGNSRTVLAAVPIDSVKANPNQPRRHFDPVALTELAASISSRGLLHPIIVKQDGRGFLIMAGERRYRAAKLAGMRVIPVLLRNDDPIETAMIENLQRENLSPLEEAEGLGSLADRYGYTHEALAELVGKSRPYVSNTLALRKLPEHIKGEYHASPDVSREILISVARAETPDKQDMLWKLAKIRRLSVQRFRSEQAGEPGAYDEIADLARQVRRLGRKLRALETATLPEEQRQHLKRLLLRARGRIDRTLTRLA